MLFKSRSGSAVSQDPLDCYYSKKQWISRVEPVLAGNASKIRALSFCPLAFQSFNSQSDQHISSLNDFLFWKLRKKDGNIGTAICSVWPVVTALPLSPSIHPFSEATVTQSTMKKASAPAAVIEAVLCMFNKDLNYSLSRHLQRLDWLMCFCNLQILLIS